MHFQRRTVAKAAIAGSLIVAAEEFGRYVADSISAHPSIPREHTPGRVRTALSSVTVEAGALTLKLLSRSFGGELTESAIKERRT